MNNKSNKYENKKQHLNPSPKSSLYKELLFTFPQKKTFHPSPYMEVQESVNNILISPHGKFMYIHDDIYDIQDDIIDSYETHVSNPNKPNKHMKLYVNTKRSCTNKINHIPFDSEYIQETTKIYSFSKQSIVKMVHKTNNISDKPTYYFIIQDAEKYSENDVMASEDFFSFISMFL